MVVFITGKKEYRISQIENEVDRLSQELRGFRNLRDQSLLYLYKLSSMQKAGKPFIYKRSDIVRKQIEH